MIDNRNLILAIVISVAILFGFEFFFNAPERERLAQQQAQQAQTTETAGGETPSSVPSGSPDVSAPSAGGGAEAMGVARDDALDASPRVTISSPTLSGSIALKGARFDDLILTQYRENLDANSPNIELLAPAGTHNAYFADFGWSTGDSGLELPNSETLWQSSQKELTPGTPVVLSWTNSQDVRFEQEIALDENYMFTVTQRVVNNGAQSISLSPYGLISRTGHPDILGFYILHEGLIGVFNDALEEIDYSDVEDTGTMAFNSAGGWLGITDKYWMVVLAPDQQKTIDARFVHTAPAGQNKYQADFLYPGTAIPAGASFEITSHLFAGAKEVELLDGYRETLGIPLFERAVDFGWFWFLTIPFFYVLHYFAVLLGNFGLSILVVTVLIKILFFPLANKSYASMAKMRKLQPDMLRLRERYGDDKQRLNQEMMALYKKEGANPLSGCLPILIQIPVFFALYKVLFVSIEMRQAPFYGWIHDLSQPDPTSIFNLFGLLPWGVPDLGLFNVINIGVWPILMGLSMVIQHRLNPQPTDPVQAKIFAWMPVIFTFLLATFPAGLVIYWTWNNTLSIFQQMVIMKRHGVPIGRQPTAAKPSAGPPKKKPGEDKEKAEEETEAEAEPAPAASDTAEPKKKKPSRSARRRARKAREKVPEKAED
ncbi:MAG: membrane protein insertase YidC [Pseudomonadota bacterium]